MQSAAQESCSSIGGHTTFLVHVAGSVDREIISRISGSAVRGELYMAGREHVDSFNCRPLL